MPAVLEVVAHPTGPWLVKAGEFLYAVPPGLGRALRPLGGRSPDSDELRACLTTARTELEDEPCAREIETWVGELSRALAPESVGKSCRVESRQVGRPLRFRVPLVPAAWVQKSAGVLKVLAGNRGLGALALLGGAGYLTTGYLIKMAGSGPAGFYWDLGTVVAGLGLFLLSAVWHELGHAAAVARSGYPPGGIGAGVLFVIPVLFADVTAVGALTRTGRIRVDISGVVFQLAVGGVFLALASWPGMPLASAQALTLAGSSALLAVSWSLFPFIRSDGHWLLCDLLGLDDLDRPPRAPASKPLRVFLVGYQLANAVFLLMIGVYFPWRMIGLLLGLAGRTGISPDSLAARWLAAAAGLAFMGVMGIGVARRIMSLVRSARAVAKCPGG